MSSWESLRIVGIFQFWHVQWLIMSNQSETFLRLGLSLSHSVTFTCKFIGHGHGNQLYGVDNDGGRADLSASSIVSS